MRQLRFFSVLLIISVLIFAGQFISCGDDDKPTEPTPVLLVEGEKYFPAAEGDMWFYTNLDSVQIVRVVSGDTTVNGVQCLRILHNDTTKEAWQLTETTFLVHLLEGNIRFQPPLPIPFDMNTNQAVGFSSNVFIFEDPYVYESHTHGNLYFKGYLTRSVPAGEYDSVIDLYYDVVEPEDRYHEYYAKNIGLLDNGDLVLDSAFVGGVWYKP